jgi:hypothetical protein
MPIDPQINPTIVYPVLLLLVVLFLGLRLMRAEGRLQTAALLLIGGVIVVFFLSRTPLF